MVTGYVGSVVPQSPGERALVVLPRVVVNTELARQRVRETVLQVLVAVSLGLVRSSRVVETVLVLFEIVLNGPMDGVRVVIVPLHYVVLVLVPVI